MSRITLPILDAVTLRPPAARCWPTPARRSTGSPRCRWTTCRRRRCWISGTPSPSPLENIEGPIAILNNVHPDKAVRDAADDGGAAAVELSGRDLPERSAVRTRAGRGARNAGRDAVPQGPGRVVRRHRRARCRPTAARAPRRSPSGSRRSTRSSRATCATTRRAWPSRRRRCEGLPEPYLSRQPRDEAGTLPALVRLPRLQSVHGERRVGGRAPPLLRRRT